MGSETEIKEILKKLPPTNDLCKSLLGVNDHLITSIPNLCQLTWSNLIETKKNKTMQWLDKLPQEERDHVVGKSIEHKFEVDDGEFEWFQGFVVAYDEETSLHEVVYEGEQEHCHFNLVHRRPQSCLILIFVSQTFFNSTNTCFLTMIFRI